METFLFGPDEGLFGAYWEGGSNPQAPAVLICNGFGQDYMRSNMVLQHTARMMADAGCAVLLFDYYGTGDSAGDSEEADLGSLLRDTQIAKQELLEISGRRRMVSLGIRLGAWMALQVSERAVIWDPIVDGKAMVTELLELTEKIPQDSFRFPVPRDVAGVPNPELAGFRHSGELLEQLNTQSLSALVEGRRYEWMAMLSSAAELPNVVTPLLEGRCHQLVTFERGSDHWNQLAQLEIALVPSPELRQLTSAVVAC